VDIISDLSRIRTILSENKKENSDEKEVLIDLLTFLIPDHSVYSPNVVYLDRNSWYDVPEYVFEEFEGELGVLCHRYGLNVDFDYIVED